MKLNFIESRSKILPKKVDETSSPNCVFIRDCIKQDEQGYYVYKEAVLSKDEYIYAICNNIDISYPQAHYEQKLETPVQYLNGFNYKPSYVTESYVDLLSKGAAFPVMFPLKIYDVTHKEANAVFMTIEELAQLTVFLASKQEQYFQEMQMEKANND